MQGSVKKQASIIFVVDIGKEPLTGNNEQKKKRKFHFFL
jgi:hypothetical protein